MGCSEGGGAELPVVVAEQQPPEQVEEPGKTAREDSKGIQQRIQRGRQRGILPRIFPRMSLCHLRLTSLKELVKHLV